MRIDDLPPDRQDDARRLLEELTRAAARDLEQLACLLAAKDDRELLGATEFQVRDAAPGIGARAIEASLAGRKKGATGAPPDPARTAASRPSSSATAPGG